MPTQFLRGKGFAGGYEEPKLEIPNWNSNNFFNGNWTYEAWVKLTGMPTSENIDFLNFSGHVRLAVRDADSVTKLRFFIVDGFEVMASTGSRWANSSWHHVAFVRDGGTIRMYCDGVQIYTGEHAFNVAISTSFLYFGSRNFPDGSLLSEIRLWSTARTSSQILDNYQKEVAANSSGLNLLYRFTDIPIPVDYSTVAWVTVPNLGTAGSSMNSRFLTYPWWTAQHAGIFAVNDHPYPDAPVSGTTLPNGFLAASSVASGAPLAISASRENLAALTKVAASVYFSNSANWKFAVMYYLGTNGQKVVVSQRANADFAKSFKATASSSVVFRLRKIVIKGRNNTLITVRRSDLENASSADITIS